MIIYSKAGNILGVAPDLPGDRAQEAAVVAAIDARPEAQDGYKWVLSAALEWDLVPLPADPPITDREALDIILGGDEIGTD